MLSLNNVTVKCPELKRNHFLSEVNAGEQNPTLKPRDILASDAPLEIISAASKECAAIRRSLPGRLLNW